MRKEYRGKTGAVLKGADMFKSVMTHLRAVAAVIATENLKALRVLLKSIGESITKSFHVHRRT